MGLCKNCLYCKEIKESGTEVYLPYTPINKRSIINYTILKNLGKGTEEKLTLVCANSKRAEIDGVTGEDKYRTASYYNNCGQCPFYFKKEPPAEPYFEYTPIDTSTATPLVTEDDIENLFVSVDDEYVPAKTTDFDITEEDDGNGNITVTISFKQGVEYFTRQEIIPEPEKPPLDIPELPDIKIVYNANEFELTEEVPEQELSVKCYAYVKGNGKLSYKWFVNGEEIEEETAYELNLVLDKIGTYTIRCEVTNTDNTCADFTERTVYNEFEAVTTGFGEPLVPVVYEYTKIDTATAEPPETTDDIAEIFVLVDGEYVQATVDDFDIDEDEDSEGNIIVTFSFKDGVEYYTRHVVEPSEPNEPNEPSDPNTNPNEPSNEPPAPQYEYVLIDKTAVNPPQTPEEMDGIYIQDGAFYIPVTLENYDYEEVDDGNGESHLVVSYKEGVDYYTKVAVA